MQRTQSISTRLGNSQTNEETSLTDVLVHCLRERLIHEYQVLADHIVIGFRQQRFIGSAAQVRILLTGIMIGYHGRHGGDDISLAKWIH